MSATTVAETYAESVMLGLLSADGTEEVSVRLARFPARHVAHVWLHLAAAGEAWSVVDEGLLPAGADVTPVAGEAVAFAAQCPGASLRFESTARHTGAMCGRVTGELTVSRTRHPEVGSGAHPCLLDLEFRSAARGYRTQNNRWELTGSVRGSVTIDARRHEFAAPGKWHEQTGPRASFGPPFTYLNLQGDDLALLAIRYPRRVTGYALIAGAQLDIESFTIAAAGSAERPFRVVLSSQQVIEGVARVVQQWSVPIEGRRRPGAAVLADSSAGCLYGNLNDWDPGA